MTRFRLFPLLLLGAVQCAPSLSPAPVPATGFTTTTCFPIDRVGSADRAFADSVLQELADGAGLYTFIGGLKPISDERTQMVRVAPTIDTTGLAFLDRWRRLLPVLECGPIGMMVLPFAATFPGADTSHVNIAASLVLYHRASIRQAITRHAQFFARLGITPSSRPEEVVGVVERAARANRWRGYGYLFGYPDSAVDFFVEAGLRGDSLGIVVARDFRRIETYTKHPAQTGAPPTLSTFVYAVPKGAKETQADIALRERAAAIYADYLRRRPAAAGGYAAMLREWIGAGGPGSGQ